MISTKAKVFGAKILYKAVRVFKRDTNVVVVRKGVRYALDLTEGIDLAVYLSGGFQKHLFNSGFQPDDGCAILDVGANCGVVSLSFAKRFPNAMVYAFEPTEFAYEKLLVNFDLNKESVKNVMPVKAFVGGTDSECNSFDIYSSWKVDGAAKGDVHPTHLGIKKAATDVPCVRIDSFVSREKIKKVGFIKVDTDGNEWGVFLGAAETIKRDLPVVVFEVGGYLLEEKGLSFEVFIEFFEGLGYRLFTQDLKKVISFDNYRSVVPGNCTIDVFAIAKE